MLIEEPTYDNLLPFLGRHVTVSNATTSGTGRLAAVFVNKSDEFMIVIDDGKDHGGGSRLDRNFRHANKCKHVGPDDITLRWANHVKSVLIHEPVNPIKPKLNKMFWLIAPLLIGIFKR